MNEGYDDFLDALESGDGYYLECANGHGSLPPRRVCPHCGSRDLAEADLPETGHVESYTVIHVPAPSFQDEAPYATAVADFGSVRLTGRVRGDPESVDVGQPVRATVDGSDDDRGVAFEPQ